MTRAPWLYTLIPLCAVLAACGTDDPMDADEEDFSPPAEMVGTWIFQSVTENGNPAQLADALEWIAGAVGARLHIESNDAYVYEEVDGSGGQLWFESGFVIVDGDIVNLNALLDSDGSTTEETDLRYTLAGGVFTLELVEGASTYLFTLTM